MSAYELIEAEKANPGREMTVVDMVDLLGVSSSGYYDWRARRENPGARQRRRQELTREIREIHAASDGVYGAPRIHAELRERGWHVSRKTVAKVMRACHIQGISPRPWVLTTTPGESPAIHPDRVGRAFDRGRLDAVWVSDITYLHTGEGWLYLAAIRDACSRRVLGWAIADHLRTDLVLDAVKMAVSTRGGNPHGVILHADRGTQYTSHELATYATSAHIQLSVGATGVCWDNAMAESFWATLKLEYYNRHSWPTKAAARAGVGTWITRYNTQRRHSALGMMAPLQYELLQHSGHKKAA
ncbi:MAG TPA: IS3 family transposase [Actinomycetales bacterium]|nr:IS3 family transposase [Actinomycetales bacterium]